MLRCARPRLLAMRGQTYLYVSARADPNFRLATVPVGMQAFGNLVGPPSYDASGSGSSSTPDLHELGRSMADMPEAASPVRVTDGYKPEAMLFVDEQFVAANRASREGRMASLLWTPVVRFVSTHYRYLIDGNEPRLIQVGVGCAEDPCDALDFGRPPAETGALPVANPIQP